MARHHINSLHSVRGKLAHRYTEMPGAIEKEEYQTALQGYSQFDKPLQPLISSEPSVVNSPG